ncbi:MAG TPA: hypothetical protein VJM83_04190 [Nitrospirota bacterium]|nr:hypothetical protein [Nitrospirota bacterium]
MENRDGYGGIKPRRAALMAGMALLCASLASCGGEKEAPSPARLAPITPAPGETPAASLARKEDQPPHIKIKREKDGSYTWEITGKDVKGIIEADSALRRRLKAGSSGAEGPEK